MKVYSNILCIKLDDLILSNTLNMHISRINSLFGLMCYQLLKLVLLLQIRQLRVPTRYTPITITIESPWIVSELPD